MVGPIFLIVATVYKYRNSGRAGEYNLKTPLGNLLKALEVLGMGVFLSVIPSLVGHYLEPSAGCYFSNEK